MAVLIALHYVGMVILVPVSTCLTFWPLKKAKLPRWYIVCQRIGGASLMVFTLFDFLLDFNWAPDIHARILQGENLSSGAFLTMILFACIMRGELKKETNKAKTTSTEVVCKS